MQPSKPLTLREVQDPAVEMFASGTATKASIPGLTLRQVQDQALEMFASGTVTKASISRLLKRHGEYMTYIVNHMKSNARRAEEGKNPLGERVDEEGEGGMVKRGVRKRARSKTQRAMEEGVSRLEAEQVNEEADQDERPRRKTKKKNTTKHVVQDAQDVHDGKDRLRVQQEDEEEQREQDKESE